MAKCLNKQPCLVCGKLLIHRGTRSRYESSSYMGQIVLGLCPKAFFWGDIDGVVWRREIGLLRFIEHKSPEQSLPQHGEYGHIDGQRELLELLADMIEHCKQCPSAELHDGYGHLIRLHAKSGSDLVEGDPHEGNQLGDCKITNLRTGEIWIPETEEEALCWVAETWEPHLRRE